MDFWEMFELWTLLNWSSQATNDNGQGLAVPSYVQEWKALSRLGI